MSINLKNNTAFSFLIVIIFVGVLVLVNSNVEEVSGTNMEQIEGVEITIEKEGIGNSAKRGDTLLVNYTGTFMDGTPFDSNVMPEFGHVEPFEFTLGVSSVIEGWHIGVEGMKEGERRKLGISPGYAYGESGAGGVIPPNATLIFDVELLEIK